MLVALAELWAFYGVLARVPAEIVTNVPNTALCLLVVLLVAWRRAAMRAYLVLLGALSAFIAAFAVACAVARADNIEAIIAVVASLGLCMPQLWRSLKDQELSGLSPASWGLTTLASLSWMLYGLAIAKIPIYLPCALTVPLSLIIAVRARSQRPALAGSRPPQSLQLAPAAPAPGEP